MKHNNEYFKGIINILKELNTKYPNQGIARHLHDATLEHKNLWGLDDKELHFSLVRYKQELDFNIVDDKEINEILKDGMDLDSILSDEQDWE